MVAGITRKEQRMLTIINDLHANPSRVGGTTQESRNALQWYVIEEIGKVLSKCHLSDTLVLMGDIFNGKHAELWVIYQVSQKLRAYAEHNPDTDIYLVRGNHDSKSTSKEDMCALEFLFLLCEDIVSLVFTDPLTIYDEDKSFLIIPHMFDQAEFDLAIKKEIDSANRHGFVLVHCNIDNTFAVGADHSLNLDKNQIKDLQKRGVHVIAAHEHQQRKPFPNVTVIGNQFPTSVADCLGNKTKSFIQILHGVISRVETWEAKGNFADAWIDDVLDLNGAFIRFKGEMEPGEYSKAIQEIAEFRKKTSAFVVANAIKVIRKETEIAEAEVTKVNVINMMLEVLSDQHKEKVMQCL